MCEGRMREREKEEFRQRNGRKQKRILWSSDGEERMGGECVGECVGACVF